MIVIEWKFINNVQWSLAEVATLGEGHTGECLEKVFLRMEKMLAYMCCIEWAYFGIEKINICQ